MEIIFSFIFAIAVAGLSLLRNFMKIIFSFIFAIAVAGLYTTHSDDAASLAKVQSGELTLECHIGDGYKVINPALVTDFSDGRWFFTNGSATQCLTH